MPDSPFTPALRATLARFGLPTHSVNAADSVRLYNAALCLAEFERNAAPLRKTRDSMLRDGTLLAKLSAAALDSNINALWDKTGATVASITGNQYWIKA